MSLRSTKYHFLQQKYKNDIYNYSFYMLRNRMDADDATQEVLIKTWENIDKFNILAAKTWIIRTTHNLCIDYLRRRKSKSYKEVTIDEEFSDSFKDNDVGNNPVNATHNKMLMEKVKNIIKKLPENLRSVFVLYEIQGMKYREISVSLNIPLNSVKVYLMRARKELQKELIEYELQDVI